MIPPTTPRTASTVHFFNRHYDSYCYCRWFVFSAFNEEAEQYLVAAVLRRGNATGSLGAWGFCAV